VDQENPSASQHNPRRAALRLVAVAAVVAVGGVAFSLLPHAKTVAPVATVAPTLPPLTPYPIVGLGFSVAADPAAHQVVLFGGVNSSDRTWLLNDQSWTIATTRTNPPARSGALAAYDPVDKRVMLFGGTLADSKGVNDTWAWNGSTWLRLDSGGANGPPPGQGAQMAWDVATGDMVLVTNGETMYSAETWTWIDSQSGSHWHRQPLGGIAVSVYGDLMAYDANSKTVLLVAPATIDGTSSLDAEWDGTAWQILTRNGPGVGAMAYYAPDNALFACGVATYSETVEVVSDCWDWLGSAWREKVLAVPPPDSKQIILEAEVWDTDNSRLIMFGWLIRAIPGQPQPLHVWSWDGEQWLQVA
jgi:hypothetical protein